MTVPDAVAVGISIAVSFSVAVGVAIMELLSGSKGVALADKRRDKNKQMHHKLQILGSEKGISRGWLCSASEISSREYVADEIKGGSHPI